MIARLTLLLCAAAAPGLAADSTLLRTFERKQLTDTYYCEGASFGDFNKDGTMDVVAGPFWYAGPDFAAKQEIYPAKPQNLKGYADNFFSFAQDFNADGWADVLVVGFPGTPSAWYENPKENKPWPRHEVFDWVSNESPHFTQLVGDERPELVCTRMGRYGYVRVNWEQPTQPWTFQRVSDPMIAADQRFGHGLGVGDVNNDGKQDVLSKDGWFEQPTDFAQAAQWVFHPVAFTGPGGAQMYAYDVDGDGDNDVITGLQAHEHGLAWFENQDQGKTFEKRLIMGETPRENRYGVVFSELHAVDLADMNGDGLKDIVTGKTYWSHHMRTPSWNDGAVVYWFELSRKDGQVEFIPHLADDDSGVGRQVVVGDLNKDGLPDIVTANMKGAFALIQSAKPVAETEWQAAQPKPRVAGNAPAGSLPKDEAGRALNLDFEDGTLKDWTAEGDAWQGQPVKGEINPARKWGEGKQAKPSGQHWLGGFEVHQDDKPTGTLTSAPFAVAQPHASYRIGGGCTWPTRLEILLADNGQLIFASHGRNGETMHPEVVDLSAYLGQKIRLRLVDEATEGFGHLNFDNFRFHAQPPVFPDAVNMPKRAGRVPKMP